jgi:mannose-6-phosphate isomerase-like protein (cupin superfamily)
MTHHTVEEAWHFISGRSQMWRRTQDQSEIVDVGPAIAIAIPVGIHFQFRFASHEP